MDNRKDDDGDENNAAGVGEDKMSKADKMQRQASANNLGDRQGDGTTFTFAIDDDQKSMNPLVRQYTSAELIDALKGADSAALDDQDKISSFISQLKKGDIATNKKTSEFRKKRLTYEHIPTNAPLLESPNKIPSQQPTPVLSKEKSKPKRTTIFASSEIGVRQDKKPPFVSSLMGTFSCHGESFYRFNSIICELITPFDLCALLYLFPRDESVGDRVLTLLSLPSSYLLGIEPGEDEDGEDAVHDKINQDRGCVVYPYRSSDDEALFMVLDGHGEQGDRISEFVMRQVT
jgi:hypothetical protein